MTRIRRLTLAALLLGAALVPANRASAGPILDWLGCGDCPPPAYSPARYWAPRLARLYDCVCGPSLPVYATNLHPEIPPDVYVLKFPCPPAAPGETLIPTPTPPPTSRFQYLSATQQ
jgi:hypothetical protein